MINKKFGTPEWYEEAEKLAKQKRAAVGDYTSIRGDITTITKNHKTGKNESLTKEFVIQYDYGNITYDYTTGTSYFYDDFDKDILICSVGNDRRGDRERFVYAFSNGRLISKANTSKGFTITYEYDKRGRLIKAVVNYPNSSKTFTTYKYDKAGCLVEEKSKYSTATFKYDEKALTVEKTLVRTLKGGETKTTTYTYRYNEDGELIEEVSGKLIVERRYENGACVYKEKTLFGKTIQKYSGVFGSDEKPTESETTSN